MPDWIHSGIRAVVFDAVGTLLFPEPSAPVVYAEVAHRAGLNLSVVDIRAKFVEAYQIEERIDHAAGWITSEEREHERWRNIVATTLRGVPDPEACFRELFEHFSKPTSWKLGLDVVETIGKLHERGLAIGLGSNYDARLLSVLDGFPELLLLRGRVVISAAVGFRKPAGEFFREVAHVMGYEPAQILFVGDDVANDYEGASNSGLNAVLLDERNRHPTLLTRIHSLSELITKGSPDGTSPSPHQ